MKNLQTIEDVARLISIGFCQPKFYKPYVWSKSKKVMDKLCALNVGVVAYNFGHGKGKYTTNKEISNEQLAEIYLNNQNTVISV